MLKSTNVIGYDQHTFAMLHQLHYLPSNNYVARFHVQIAQYPLHPVPYAKHGHLKVNIRE